MPLFRRTAEDSPPETAADSASPDVETSKVGGKGRPTPKRREAEKSRRNPVLAPQSRREAYKLRRSGIREDRRRTREALVKGDERNLPPRDAGPARRYARDVVDGRRNAGALFLPAAVLLLFASSIRVSAVAAGVTFVYIVLLVAVALDAVLLARRVKRDVRDRYGEKQTYGVGMYAVMRSLQLRRLRMPPPKVRRGEPPRG